MSAESVVNDFLAAICDNDLDRALSFCADDVEYDNVPIGKVHGHDGMRQVLAGFLGGASEIDWVVHRQAATGNLVLNERLDRFKMANGWLELPVAGVFEVSDDKITLWRDYFDMPTLQQQMGG